MKTVDTKFGQKSAGRNRFKVPEGYFDQLTERVMSQLPEQQVVAKRPTMWGVRYRKVWIAAACVCGLAFGIGLYEHHEQKEKALMEANVQQMEPYFDQMADYAMYDNEEIYASLSEY